MEPLVFPTPARQPPYSPDCENAGHGSRLAPLEASGRYGVTVSRQESGELGEGGGTRARVSPARS